MSGVFIAGMGLPGSGKSSVMGALSNLLNTENIVSTIYKEPEEVQWPPFVNTRETTGYLTTLTWFRSIRVPNIFQASKDAKDGKVAIVDSFYDKLIHLYFDKPGFEWLMPKDDPYRDVFKSIASLDYEKLPNCCCLIFFNVSESRWQNLVDGRGRELDRNANLKTLHHTQDEYLKAAKHYCNSIGIKLLEFENNQNTLADSAKFLYQELIKSKILNEQN